jgi:hypothetical protein
MSWIAVGIAGGSALLKFGEGVAQNSKAKSIEKNNPYPSYAIPQEYQQNVNTAQQLSQEGIPAQAYNNQLSQIGQNQAGAVSALGKSANPGAGLSSIVRQGDQANNNLNAQDALQRNRNMLTLLQERQTLAQQKDKQWDWNYQQKYLGNLAKSQALRTSGNSNIAGALSDASGTATTTAKLMGGNSGTANPLITGGYVDNSPVGADQSTVS